MDLDMDMDLDRTGHREMYDNAMDGVMNVLLKTSDPSGLAYLADFTGFNTVNKMDHLVCFMPGPFRSTLHTAVLL